MSWFSQQWNRFANQFDDESTEPIQRVEVVWGRERLAVPVNEHAYGQKTLRDLKHEVSRLTSVPYEQVKLIVGGLILKDEKAPLSAFGIRNGSRLTLVGTQGGVPVRGDMPGAKSSVMEGKLSKGEELARRKKEREEDVSEQGLLSRIEESLTSVRRDLAPEVVEFEKFAESNTGAAAAPRNGSGRLSYNTFEAVAKQQRKLSELLLRALLALDSIHVNSDETRKSRKEAVKEIQAYLDRVDAAWSKVKAKGREEKEQAA